MDKNWKISDEVKKLMLTTKCDFVTNVKDNGHFKMKFNHMEISVVNRVITVKLLYNNILIQSIDHVLPVLDDTHMYFNGIQGKIKASF